MLQTMRHQFSAQFSLLFQMLCSILLAVLPLKTPTADWWKTFNSQSGFTKGMVFDCNTESKTECQSAPSERVLKTEVRKSNDRLFVAFSLTYFIRLLENPRTASPVLELQ